MAFFSGLAAIAGGLFSSAFGLALTRVAIGVGLSLLGSKLSKKKQSKTQSYDGVKGTLQSGGDVARSFVMGRSLVAGSLIYANTWNGDDKKSPNAYLTQVIALSDMDIRRITGMWVNETPVVINDTTTFQGFGHPVFANDGTYNGNLWLHFYDGTQEIPSSLLTGVASAKRPYDVSRVGRGMVYVVITALADSKVFSSMPNFKFEVQGMKLYDPSRDSSIGGNGTHRLADPSTWGGDGDDLPAVQIYNLLLGVYRRNSLNQRVWFYGMQNMTQARLPSANWIAAANFCREQVQGPSGLEPRFLSGIEIPVDAELAETIDAIREACNGDLVDTGGQYRIIFAEPSASVASITDGDILDEGQDFIPFHTLDSSINAITASYPEPDEAWNIKVATPAYSADYETLDGGRRLVMDVKFTSVYKWSQVQRLIQSSLKATRRERKHIITVPHIYWQVEVGDTITWTSARNYYSNKQFRVDFIRDTSDLNLQWTITEVDPNDFAIPDEYIPPEFTQTGVIKPDPQVMVDWYAEPSEIRDSANNARRPAIRLHWYTDLTDIQGVLYEVALVPNGAPVVMGTIDDYTLGVVDIANYGILPNQTYYVRGRYKVPDTKTASWSDWLAVTTPNILLGALDVFVDVDLENLKQEVKEHLHWVTNSQEFIYQNIERMDKLVADIAADQYSQVQVLKREINATVGNVRAGYREEISVVASETEAVALKTEELSAIVENVDAKFTERTIALANDVEAWANRTTTIEGKISDPSTGLQANATAINSVDTKVTNFNNQLTAISNRVDTTQAQVGNVSASGLFRVTAEANNVSGSSKIGLSAAVTKDDVTKQAALFITANSDSRSEIQMIADRISFLNPNGSDYYRPFVIQNGIMYAQDFRVNWAKIDDVQINSAQIQDGSITNAKIGYAEIQSSNLGIKSVTKDYWFSGEKSSGRVTNTALTFSTENGQSGTALFQISCSYSAYFDVAGIATVTVVNNTTGSTVWSYSQSVPKGTQSFGTNGFMIDASSIVGTNNYTVSINKGSGTGNTEIRAIVWQR